jgi:hypothetical protein
VERHQKKIQRFWIYAMILFVVSNVFSPRLLIYHQFSRSADLLFFSNHLCLLGLAHLRFSECFRMEGTLPAIHSRDGLGFGSFDRLYHIPDILFGLIRWDQHIQSRQRRSTAFQISIVLNLIDSQSYS